MPFKKIPPLYMVWASMRDRCNNPNNRQFADYGGRGIKVCERWESYGAWLADMGPRPLGHSLDRRDNNKGYEPGNCRWATRREQQRNQRRAVWVTIDGERYRAIELAEQYNLKPDTIVARAKRNLCFSDVVTPHRHVFKEGLALGGRASGAKQQAKTHCSNGHEFTPENTRLTKEGWRNCRACAREKAARYRAEELVK